MLNQVASAPASHEAAPALPVIDFRDRSRPERRALKAYSEWLHMERRLLCMEMYPGVKDADGFVPVNTGARDFHFPMGMSWQDRPQPSTRAAAVLDMVGGMIGADWRRPARDRGEPLPGSVHHLIEAEREACRCLDAAAELLDRVELKRKPTAEEEQACAAASDAQRAAELAVMTAEPTSGAELIAMIQLFEARERHNIPEPDLLWALLGSVKAFVAGRRAEQPILLAAE